MNAVIDTPSGVRKPRASTARVVAEVTPLPQPFGYGAGRHLVVDHENLAWPEADKGDVLDIDFDVREYRGEGRYLLHHSPPAGEVVGAPGCWPFSSRWTCVQEIHRSNGQFERFVHGESRGWKPIPTEEWERIQILGKVHGIYNRRERYDRPGVLEVGRVTGIGEAEGGAYIHLQPEAGRTITISGLTEWQVRTLSGLVARDMRMELKA
ncbi:hypothetical protein [Acidovorax sp. NCPPB 3576]|uniref:hypothetical protein n=1 Tax=Acidovorax sp. NCPPB 3576 TaxID=2940488 RepID=UPI002349064E|nr:hypothetical protein [Acidovorax sp. NCPPB 3576]WCM88808.1 hypothetical protein M5C98_01775 [Acidovorax sp. NCPPB 3576]